MTVLARLLAFFTIAVALATPATVLAQTNTFYVATDGADGNPGTSGQPWRTLRYAVAQLRAGDTLYLRGGTYTGSANSIDSQASPVPSGESWSAPITVAGYQGESVIIQPPNNTPAIRLTSGTPHYLVFQDFTIDMSNNTVGAPSGGADGVYVSRGAHHNRFLRLTVHHNIGNCFQLPRSPEGIESPFNEIVDSTIHTCGTGPGTADNDGYSIYNSTDDTLISGNTIYNIGGYGIASYGSRVIIRNNRIHDSGVNGATNYGIVIGSFSHPTQSLDCLIYNNLIYKNQGGILLYSNSGNIGVYNNTIYSNTPFAGIAMQYYASGSTIRNNIVYGNGAAIVDNGGGTGAHTLDHNLLTDPAFVNAAASDFELRSTSTARNAGVTITTVSSDFSNTPRLGTYDIGAYEYAEFNGLTAPLNLRVVSTQ